MTVAVGLVCRDGVIVASDSMGSAGSIAVHSRKVHTLSCLPVAWTAAGSVYVIEEVEAALRTSLDEVAAKAQAGGKTNPVLRAFTDPDLDLLRRKIRETITKTQSECYGSALPFGPQTAGPTGGHPFLSDFLVVGYANDTPYFLEVDSMGQVNWHTDRRFAAVGSGFQFATVTSALMAHYLEGERIALNLGLRVAFRAIETTCQVSNSMVGLPVQLAVVDEKGARVLDPDEVEEVRTGVAAWKELERNTLREGDLELSPPDQLPEYPAEG